MIVLTQYAIPLLEWYGQNAVSCYYTVCWDCQTDVLTLIRVAF